MATLFESDRNIEANQQFETATAAANTAVTITLPSVSNVVRILNNLWFSYSGTPTGGGVTITIDGVTFLDLDITTGGPGPLPLNRMNDGKHGSEVIVTLKAGGSGVVGKLVLQYY